MGDSGLPGAIAQWIATIGVPAMVLAWYRLWVKAHELQQRIAVMESMELGKIQPMLTDIRIIVGELKVRLDYQARGMQPGDHNRRATDRSND